MALRMTLAVAALGAAVAVSAADAPADSRRSDLEKLDHFSACIVDRDRDEAEQVLQGDFREERYTIEMRRLALKHKRCLGPFGGELRAAGVLFAGAVAENLLRENMTQAELAASLRPPEPAIEARSASEYTALCMALTHPADTSTLLFSKPLEEESEPLLFAYTEKLPPCVQAGQELRINMPGLRAIVALAAYRLARANRSGEES